MATRTAVRDALRPLRPPRATGGEPLVLVACSGGADSVALAAAAAWVARRSGMRAGAVIVDHGLQDGSDEVAAAAAATCRGLGLDPVEVVAVDARSGAGRGGPEKVARDARLSALRDVAHRVDAVAVLLGHTRDDQAETVLLGLARGSGARSLAGMAGDAVLAGNAGLTGDVVPAGDAAVVGVRVLRPFLGLDRATVRAAATASGLPVWEDPHNTLRAYARVRARSVALPALEEALGPGVTAALARTADLLRADADALDRWAADAYERAGGGDDLDVDVLAGLPVAVRTRVIMRAAHRAGSPPARLTAGHIRSVEALVSEWRGQGPVDLPGRVRVERRCGRLRLAAPVEPGPAT